MLQAICFAHAFISVSVDALDIQIPEELCKEGQRFMVEDLKPSDSGGFYRIFGAIQAIE